VTAADSASRNLQHRLRDESTAAHAHHMCDSIRKAVMMMPHVVMSVALRMMQCGTTGLRLN
jgi:hypothetical protein